MSVPKRYDLEYVDEDSDRQEMVEEPDGEWIKWSDYYKLREAAFGIVVALLDLSRIKAAGDKLDEALGGRGQMRCEPKEQS